MHCAFGIDIANRPEWWRRPELGELTAIANRTGLAVECIQSMTLAGWTQERADERHERFEAVGFQRQQISPATRRPTPICGLCLEEAVVPFLRLEWTIGWVAVCPDHRTALITHCPACYTRLTQPSQITGREVALDRCQRCDFQINGLAGTPAQDSVCRLQTQLMALKRTGSGNLPEQGRMTWPIMIGLIDLILAAVWSTDARHSRERLFDQVLADSGFADADRLGIRWSSNHGTMLILAWLFEAWPRRMTHAMDILRVPGLAELAVSVAAFGDELRPEVIKMLADIVPDRPPIKNEWRTWMASLSCAMDSLRQYDESELRPEPSRMLKRLMDLPDRANVATAAEWQSIHGPPSVRRPNA